MKKFLYSSALILIIGCCFNNNLYASDPFKDAAEDAVTKLQTYLYAKHHGGDTSTTAVVAIASVSYLNDNFDTEQEWLTADQRWSPITQIGCVMGCARWYADCMKNDHSIGAFIKCSDAADKCMALCGVHLLITPDISPSANVIPGKGGGFKVDFDNYIDKVNNLSATMASHGDTATAVADMITAANALSGYDLNQEFQNSRTYWPVQAVACLAGCAKWYYENTHPYPGIESLPIIQHMYEDCISHCH